MKKSYTRYFAFFYALMIFSFLSFCVVGENVDVPHDKNVVHVFHFSDNPLGNLAAFAGIYWLCRKCISWILVPRNKVFYFFSLIICGVFSFVSVLSTFFIEDVSLYATFSGQPLNILLTGLVFFAGMATFFAIIQLIGALSEIPSCQTLNRFSKLFFEKGMFWKSLALMTVVWLPQIIYSAPGTLTIDTINSLEMYWGAEAATTQHPIFYTLFVGKMMDLGIKLGKPALGLIFVVAIQTILLLLVLAYTLQTMKRFKSPSWLLALTLAFFTFSPIFCSMASTAIIDTLYGTFFLLLMNELVYYLFKRKLYFHNWMHYLLTAVAIMGLHFRHNGIYISMAVLVVSIIMELFLLIKKEQKFVFSLLILAILVIPAFGGKKLSSSLYDSYDAQRLSSRAMLSLPIQQTARCLAIYGNEIDPAILSDIQRVLTWDVEDYKKAYDPLSFDGVKRSFNPNASSEDLKAFLRGWLKLVRTYPTDCLSATLNQTYFLFNPTVLNQKYYRSPSQKLKIEGYNFKEFNRQCRASSIRLVGLHPYYYEFGLLPVFGLLINQGFTNFILLSIALYALCKKDGRLLSLCIPLLLTLAICFVGPMVAKQPRYTYPIMYSLPLLTGIFISVRKTSD